MAWEDKTEDERRGEDNNTPEIEGMSGAFIPTAIPPTPTSTQHLHRRQRPPLLQGLDSWTTMQQLKQHHSLLIRLGLSDDNDAVGRAIKFCSLHPSGDLDYAFSLFHSLSNPDPFIYNTLIRATSNSSSSTSFRLYTLMLQSSVLPNQFTFPALLKSASSVEIGQMIHAQILKIGFFADPYAQNGLIHMYASGGCLDDARKVFDAMMERDVVSWTTLFTGYAKQGLVGDARDLFDKMPDRNSVSWNAMVAAYVQSGRFRDAFDLFERMRVEGVSLDKFVAASMLSACAAVGALEQGQWIHETVVKREIDMDPKLATTVIDMYCKCGCVEKAYEVFDGLAIKGLSSWNCMIGGLAVHGQATVAIELFKNMMVKNLKPDGVTLLNVLTACAHGGLVKEGRHYFDYMISNFGIEPKMEHYGCLVDLLGRAGFISEAKRVIDEMPMEPDAGVLGALLGACRVHGEFELGVEIGRKAIELEPHNSGRYVLLANLYASIGQWDDVANVRKLMNERGVSKEPGCSMIEMDGVVSEFIAGGYTHPQSAEIYAKVGEVLERIKMEGYVPNTGEVFHDIDEEEKESQLQYHSEKLAIAFGLLNTRAGETIRISKNLRVCRDCHEVSKFISKVFDRQIVVRDRNRFHHFRDGLCSCKDFW